MTGRGTLTLGGSSFPSAKASDEVRIPGTRSTYSLSDVTRRNNCSNLRNGRLQSIHMECARVLMLERSDFLGEGSGPDACFKVNASRLTPPNLQLQTERGRCDGAAGRERSGSRWRRLRSIFFLRSHCPKDCTRNQDSNHTALAKLSLQAQAAHSKLEHPIFSRLLLRISLPAMGSSTTTVTSEGPTKAPASRAVLMSTAEGECSL